MTRRRSLGDDGSVLVLTIGLVVVVMLLVAVVAAASKLFLTRRSLASVADGAALAAAQDVDLAALYAGQAGATLPLAAERARADAAAYVARAMTDTGLTDLRVVSVTVAGRSVDVTVSARSVLPFASAVTGDPEGTVITVTAHAEAAVGP